MPYHLKAYIYILIPTILAFVLLKQPMTNSLMTEKDFSRRRNAWFLITATLFLSHNYLVYAVVASVIVWLLLQRDQNVIAVYVSLLFAAPLFKYPLPGFGIINYLFILDHQRLFALVALAPVAFRLIQLHKNTDWTTRLVWWGTVLYILQYVANSMIHESFTMALRAAVTEGLTVLLPLYVALHYYKSVRSLRETMMMFVGVMAVLALIAIVETGRGWLLYESVRGPLGVQTEKTTAYLTRDSDWGSFLRALATTGHSIILGTILMMGACWWAALRENMGSRLHAWMVLGMLMAGLLATMARGPWVGAVVGAVVIVLSGPRLLKRLMGLIGLAILVIIGLSLSPYGDKLLAFVPFIGEVGAETVDYRKRLFEVSMIVFWDSPLLGNFEAMMDPRLEQMRQGQGIIDMVNTFLGIGLVSGLVGITLFVGPALLVMYRLFIVSREVEGFNKTVGMTGRALLGSMAAFMVTIATVSFIDFVPVAYYLMLGLSANFVVNARRVVAQHRTAQAQALRHELRQASTVQTTPLTPLPR